MSARSELLNRYNQSNPVKDTSDSARNSLLNKVNGYVNADYINSFLTDAQSFFDSAKGEYNGITYGNAASTYDTKNKTYEDLNARSNLIRGWLNLNKSRLNEETYNNLTESLNTYGTSSKDLIGLFKTEKDHYAQWKTEDDYNSAVAAQKEYENMLSYDIEAGMLALEKLKKEREAYLAEIEEQRKQAQSEETFLDKLGRWLGTTPDTTIPLAGASATVSGNGSNSTSEYDKQIAELENRINLAKYVQGYKGYMDYIDAEDYAANNQYVSTRTDVEKKDALIGLYRNMYDENKLFGDFLYDYINRDPDALSVATVNNVTTNATLLGFDNSFLQTMENDEIGVYNYLYKTKGKEAAEAFLSFIESDLKARQKIQEQEYWANYAKEDPVASSVFSTLISPMKGLSYLGQVADMLDDGKMDQNAGYNKFSYIPSTIRSQVSSTIESSGKWGKVGSFAYNTGMSMADFLFTTAVSGGNQALALGIMGTGAAADATLAAKDRGLADDQAFAIGTIAGLAEIAMEKISLGAWLDGDMTEGALRYVLKNAFAEGMEEAGTSTVNLLADVIIAGDKSEWKVAMQAYIAEGKSEAEAFGLVAAEQAAKIGLDALGGMLSGAAISGGTYAGSNAYAAFENILAQGMGAEGTQAKTETKPGTLEWVQEIADIGAGKEVQKNTTQASGVQYQLKRYSQHQIDNWKNSKRIVLFEGIEHFKQFIKNALSGKPQTNKKMYFGAIPTDLASVIKDATGVDVDGYNLALAENEIRKINKDHGNEETEAPRGQRAVTEADYLNIPNVVQSPDSITLSAKLYEGKPVIEFRKRNGNETSVVAAVVSDKRLDLFVQTTFVNKKTGSIATPEPVQAGSFTPKATGGTAPTDSISESSGNVNTKTADTAADTPKVAEVLTTEPEMEKTDRSLWSWMKEKVFDKGMVFETLALKTKNRELQAKWNATRYAQRRAQWLIGNGTENIKSLNEIREEVESTGKTEQFSYYLYHKHNIDRMQLEARYEGVKNKPVLGDSVTAEVSREAAAKLEETNPEFKQLAEDVYSYMNYLRQLLVDNGVISQDTANLWAEMYPHYVPIRRAGKNGRSINVPLDTGRTGVNTPVKKAKGGDRDILPVFDTMAQRTLQTYTAIARNSFGVELKNTLKSTVSKTAPGVDEVIDSIDTQDGLLQEGKNGENPSFTVFENGERVTFEITDEMYDALKPTSEGWAFTFKPANVISSFHRGLLTEYNPTFLLTNAIKDVQDVLINSQHPAKTYAKIPQAYVELTKKGKWYREYMANGGEHNTYFNSDTNTFEAEDKGLKKLLDMPPLSTISKLNSSIEMAPRLAEYMASREEGSSIDVAMLDAARVTTNFAAGGDLTKLLDRNGATFLNASVQGLVQQVWNIREAKMNGAKGWVSLATKFTLAGLPALLLNGLIWDDDEDYAELSDYVKDNYYIVGKYGDGQFVRIPKGRVTAVIQSAIEQISNTVTGNDEADWQRFAELVISNFAPNNPADNNVLSPIIQAVKNKTWYGEDLVPTRLQDLPAAEQYDESTDAFSKWLGEKLNISPVKINYLLNQYGGGVADTVLPMLTPKAESGDDSVIGTLLAPLKDKFTVDSVMSNQNITDFYDRLDELTTNAKASNASVEDKIRYKYINSVSADLRDLYAEKRKVQSGDLPDDQKYAQVRSIQQKIADTAQKALEACQNPYSADKSAMVAGVIGDSFTDLTDCWKNGVDTAGAVAAIDQAYGAYEKMDNDGKASVKAEGGRVADYLAARESGITTKTFADLYETYYSIDKGDGNASAKAAQWSYALEKAQEQGIITAAQKDTIKEEMNFWQMIPADTDRFDELTGGGLSADKADLVTEILGLLKPETGKTTVRTIQQVEAITAADDKLTEAEQKTALKSVLSDNAYEKYLEVLELGMSTDDYASSYRLYLDAEGSGKKARTIALYQEEFGISYSVAKALYEIYSPSSK